MLQEIETVLSERFPTRIFTPPRTASEIRNRRSTPRPSQREIHPQNIGGVTAAVPLSIELMDETGARSFLEALLETGRHFFEGLRSDTARLASLMPQAFQHPSPSTNDLEYEIEADLERHMQEQLGPPVRVALKLLRPGEIWNVGPDPVWSASSFVVAASGLASYIKNERRHEGGVMELKAKLDDVFRATHKALCRCLHFPHFAFEGSNLRYWDSEEAKWKAVPEWLKFAVQVRVHSARPATVKSLTLPLQLAAILSTRLQRDEVEGFAKPVIILPVMTGSLLFFATDKIEEYDGGRYTRLAVSRLYNKSDVPLRLVLFVISLLHVSVNPLSPPSDYFHDSFFKSTVTADVLRLPAEAQKAKDAWVSGGAAAAAGDDDRDEGEGAAAAEPAEAEGAEEEQEEKEQREAEEAEEGGQIEAADDHDDPGGGPAPGPWPAPGGSGSGAGDGGSGNGGAGRTSGGSEGARGGKRRATSQSGASSPKKARKAKEYAEKVRWPCPLCSWRVSVLT